MNYFKIPGTALADDTRFSDMHIWNWAKTQARKDVNPFKYLDSCGFVVGADKITENEFDCLRQACDRFHSCEPHIAQPMRFADAFNIASASGFYVANKPGRYHPARAIVAALKNAGWIYDINPVTTYFSLFNGIIWAKYQQILGQRPIVRIED